MSEKIDPKRTPKELDKFLQNRYNISLYCFAVSLSDVFYISDIRSVEMFEFSPLTLPWREFWLKRIKNLKKLKKLSKESREIWTEFIEKTGPYHQSYPETLRIEKKLKAINDLYEHIDLLIKRIEKDCMTPSQLKGKPSNPVNILFLVWHHFMRDKNKADIQTILSLMIWFAKRIPDFYFKEEEIKEENLKKEAFRYKKDELSTTKEKVELYVYRFYALARYFWSGKNFKVIKSHTPLIIFTNGEKLTFKDCLENKPSAIPASYNNGYRFPFVTIDFKTQKSDPDAIGWNVLLFDQICDLEKKLS